MNSNQKHSEKLNDILAYAVSIKRLSALRHHPDYAKLVAYTDYLPTTASISQRLWHAANGQDAPRCKQCNGPVSWRKELHEYSLFCGSRCAHLDPAVAEKTTNTVRVRYGTDHVSKVDEVKQKRVRTNINKYGVKNTFWANRSPSQVSEQYKKDRNKHLASPEIVMSLLSDGLTQDEIGSILGISQPRVSVLLSHLGAATSTVSKSSAFQREVCDALSQAGVRYITNHKLIPPFDVDIYCPDIKLAIEANGVYWHREGVGKDKRYHNNKTIMCNNIGVRLIHLYDTEWYAKTEVCVSRLLNACGVLNHTRIAARRCTVSSIPAKVANGFLDEYHIQGSCHGTSICAGLHTDDGQLIAVMTFGKSRFTEHQYELLRFACKSHVIVTGGASKLFSWFIRNYAPETVVSYSDRRWAVDIDQSVYKRLAFTFAGITPPNYRYMHVSGDTSVLHSRQQFQKHKLQSKLACFDPNLSEWQNMRANGYDRIWDCGNTKWCWTRE